MALDANIVAIEDRVRANINRGTLFDSQITNKVSDAFRFMERNWSFPSMKYFSTFQIVANGKDLSLALEPGIGFKRILAVWYETSDANSTQVIKNPITRINEEDLFYATPGLEPSRYYSTGRTTYEVDSAPETTINGFYSAYVYSQIPTVSSSFTLRNAWLAINGADAIEARAMITMAPILRDPKIIAMWQNLFVEALKTLLTAEDELEQGDRYDEGMKYVVEY